MFDVLLPLISSLVESENMSEDDKSKAKKAQDIIDDRVKILVLASNEGWPVG